MLAAFLDYYNIAYKVVEVNPISKKEIKWSDYKKVPILTVDGEQLVNFSDIIATLSERIDLEKSTGTTNNVDEEREWLKLAIALLLVDLDLCLLSDDNGQLLDIGGLTIIWCMSCHQTFTGLLGEAPESFDYITTHGNFSFMERAIAKYAGATAMYFVAKKLTKKYNIIDERGPKPNLADLAVFGVLRPIRRLRSGKDMVNHTRIGEWYARKEKAVGESSRIKEQKGLFNTLN
ncbi:hypothetical protein Dimus_034019 [Dionaea muscipula]